MFSSKVPSSVDEFFAVLRGLVGHVGRDVLLFVGGAEILLVGGRRPHERLHPDEVDHTCVVALRADRQLEHGAGRSEAVLDAVEGTVEVGTGAVHLVDEAHPRNVVLVGLAPHRLGLRFDAGDAVEHRNGTIEHAERALDFDGEVDVAGGVDDVDRVVTPLARGGRRGDGDASLLLLLHPVHGRGAVVDLADLVGLAGVVEDPLGRRGLARVDVGHDPDVPGVGEVVTALGHDVQVSLFENESSGSWSGPAHPVTRPGACPRMRGVSTSGSGRRPCWSRPSCGDLPCA